MKLLATHDNFWQQMPTNGIFWARNDKFWQQIATLATNGKLWQQFLHFLETLGNLLQILAIFSVSLLQSETVGAQQQQQNL